MLDNLIANAIEVSPEGTVIRLSATTTAGSMTMTMTMTVAGGRSVGLEARDRGILRPTIRNTVRLKMSADPTIAIMRVAP